MRLILPERHLKPSQRLLVGIALMASLTTSLAWGAFGRLALGLLLPWGALFAWALGYLTRSWVRIHPERGLSWRVANRGPFGEPQIGSVELHASEIAELRLESSLLARLLGLWDLQIVKRDGTLMPRLRFFQGMDRVAEELHGYLQQR